MSTYRVPKCVRHFVKFDDVTIYPVLVVARTVGENRKIERGRLQLNLASLSIHGSVKYPVKGHHTLTMTVQFAMTAQLKPRLSQITTVLQRDIEGKSYLFSQSPPVLIHYCAIRFSR